MSLEPLGRGSFQKLGVPYLGGPYNKDPTIWGTILGSPIFGNSHIAVWGVGFWGEVGSPVRRGVPASVEV